MKKILDLFFLLRPVILIPVWGFSVFGYFKAKHYSLLDFFTLWKVNLLQEISLMLLFSVSVGVVYIINQIADIEVDKKNGGFPLLASEIVSVKDAILFSLMIFLLLSSILLILNKTTLLVLCAITLIIGYLYSFRPTFFSGRILLDFISNAVGYGCIAFGAGWWIAGGVLLSSEFFIASLPYFLLMCSGSISSTLPDFEGDKKAGKNTTAVILGVKNAHYLSTALLLLASLTAFILHDYIAFICAILPVPIYFAFLIKSERVIMEATYKVGGGLCILSACLIIPAILLISLLIFASTKIYFKYRHNVNYPSMIPIKYDIK
jgi:4-hydroxybenzoate polyprenyltransferase